MAKSLFLVVARGVTPHRRLTTYTAAKMADERQVRRRDAISARLRQLLHSVALYSADQLPKGDRGGNEIPLTQGDNLHKLWDNLLGRQHYVRNVERAAVELSDRRKYGQEWESAAGETEPRKWAYESKALCSLFVYSDVIRNGVRNTSPGGEISPVELPEDYKRDAGGLARKQIVKAGVRLGVLLGGESGESGGGE